jgi:outer membrane protein assembly factor BamA
MRFLLCFLGCLYGCTLWGQTLITVNYSGDKLNGILRHPKNTFIDSSSALRYLEEIRMLAIKKGFLLASFDSIQAKKKNWDVSFHRGTKLTALVLTADFTILDFLKRNGGVNERFLSRTPFQPKELARTLSLVHSAYLNNGYPFAQVTLTDVQLDQAMSSARLSIQKGKSLSITTIHVKGDSSISLKYIESLIGIRKGDLFNEEKLQLISSKIKQIPFIKELKPHELLFTKEGIEVFLYLQTTAVSSINGAVGLQPDPATQRIGLTGELNLKLQNILRRGELVQLNWRSIQAQTQSLLAQLNYPFLFNTPFGIDGQFQLYKRDTTFLEIKSTIGVQYSMRNGTFLKGFYQNYTSNLLSGASGNPTFNALSTVRTNAYGVALTKRYLDYVPNPSKGTVLQIEIAIGSRKSQLSDTSEITRSTTYRGLLHVEGFIPITKRHVLHLLNRTEWYFAPIVFQNEVFRFGGQHSLRGFNEEELFATFRTVASLEYRFLVDRNSFAFVFFDQGWYENTSSSYVKDYPYGFGAGFSFGTRLGIFSIAYALGSQKGNPILFNNGKVHFGYITYF